ncbi:hypothetical protein GALL_384330 [mine drainage metagenome]|jgi:hypothetical protein|uniref:Uncharacterized protein n=1 Tax=mine drainage metagenome TaxID=410659 RepID=A0A1J5QIM0_9ZZZZ
MTNPFTRLYRLRLASAWVALLALALAPLAQAMRAPPRAIDVPYCDAGASAAQRGRAPARSPQAPPGHIVLCFAAGAAGAGAQPHPFLPTPSIAPRIVDAGAAPVLATRPRLRAASRVWILPPGRAPPVIAPAFA